MNGGPGEAEADVADGGPSGAGASEPGGRDAESSAASVSGTDPQGSTDPRGNGEPPSVKERWFTRERGAWIGAGGTVIAALIAVGALYLPQPGSDEESDTSPQVAGASSSPPSARQSSPDAGPSSPAPSAGTPRPPAAPAAPAVRWQGRIAFDGNAKDLDAVPPGKAATGQGDIATGGAAIVELHAVFGSTVSLWEKEGLPDHGDCAATVDAEGTSSHPLAEDTVLCVKTEEGHVARLRVHSFPEGFGPLVKFDAVIWYPIGAEPSA